MESTHSSANLSAPPAILEGDDREEEMSPGQEELRDANGMEEDLELPKEHYQGLEDLCWSLRAVEQAVYLSLPAWIHGALLCNLVAPLGLAGIHNSFPARLISYILLPYMLPASIFFFASHRWVSFPFRILWQLSKLPKHALCLWRSLRQTVQNVINVASSCLLRPRFPFLHTIAPIVMAEQEHSDQADMVRQRSMLHIQLSTSGAGYLDPLNTPVDLTTETISYSFLFNLALGMGSQPNPPFLPNTRPILERVESSSDVEVQEEKMGNGGQPGNGTFPCISFLELENAYDEREAIADGCGEKSLSRAAPSYCNTHLDDVAIE